MIYGHILRYLPTAVIFLVFAGLVSQAQTPVLDSLIRASEEPSLNDSIRCKILTDLARNLSPHDPQKSIQYADRAIRLAEELPQKKFLANAYSAKASCHLRTRNYPASLELYQKALSINESIQNKQGIASNFNNIGLIFQANFQYPKALEYFFRTVEINQETGNQSMLLQVYGNIGNIYFDLEDYAKAVQYNEKALSIAKATSNMTFQSGILNNLGNAYDKMGDKKIALTHKLQALALSEHAGDKKNTCSSLLNIGNLYKDIGDWTRANEFYEKALPLAENIKDEEVIGSTLLGLGEVQLKNKNSSIAKAYTNRALDMAKQKGLSILEANSWDNLSKIFEKEGQLDSAYFAYRQFISVKQKVDNAEVQKQITRTALQFEFSKTEDSLKQQQLLTDAKLQQSILQAQKQEQEIKLQQNAIQLAVKEKQVQRLLFLKTEADLEVAQGQNKIKEEQLIAAENEKKLQTAQVNLQKTRLDLQQQELQSQKNQRIYYISGLGLLAMLSFSFYRNFVGQKKSNRIIEAEKRKSDNLLLNILPQEVADELKEKGETAARSYQAVTVLFTDFVDFTKVAEKLTPEQLVQELHECFRAFDEIAEGHGMEKIKTIGDAYMAAAGLPVDDPRHAEKAALTALGIRDFILERQKSKPDTFRIRIGLHSGPVVAGIVGAKKFAYDIWGDTVNTASRMESASEPGKINISGETCKLLQNNFQLEYRGKLHAKNKGEIDMYFLERMK